MKRKTRRSVITMSAQSRDSVKRLIRELQRRAGSNRKGEGSHGKKGRKREMGYCVFSHRKGTSQKEAGGRSTRHYFHEHGTLNSREGKKQLRGDARSHHRASVKIKAKVIVKEKIVSVKIFSGGGAEGTLCIGGRKGRRVCEKRGPKEKSER